MTGLFVANQTYVYAHEGEDATPAVVIEEETIIIDTTGDTEIAVVPDSYQYIVQPNNNMSILARRSITLYDQGNDTIELTEAQVIFIETNIVQEMGPRLLDVNENFEVTKDLIEKYVAEAPGLSETTLAAWDGYAQNATFELSDITPINVPLNDDGSLDITYTAPTIQNDTEPQPAESTSTPAYWWVIGLVAIVGLTFILMPSQNKKTNKK